MGTAQPGLFTEETAQHLHVEWAVPDDVALDALIAAVGQARRAAQTLHGPDQVWGFAPSLWRRISDLPSDVVDFAGVTGIGGEAPATQSSIWFWAAGNAWEKIWTACASADKAITGVATGRVEQACYTAMDNRDPTGFIDGTENPALDEAAEVSLYPDGGSAVLVQKWIHDLAAFDALPMAEQEKVFGRTRADSTELPADAMPATSHVSRNVIEDGDGNELHIFRRNTPFASLAESGTMFIGCSNQPARIDRMLDRMFGATDDGLIDHLTKYSRAVNGSYCWVPSLEALTEVFGPLEVD